MRSLQPGRCRVCLDDGHEADKLMRPCSVSATGGTDRHWYHKSCVRAMFLTAAKDEGSMPPRCCGKPISDAYGFQLLSDNEIEAYKDKREEKETANRTYCPNVKCSHFITKRVIEQAIDERVEAVKKLKTRPLGYVSGSLQCPKCEMAICLICKQFSHPGKDCPEPESDGGMDESVTEALACKRCPHCRTLVVRVDGCSHLTCRCGTRFCAECAMTSEACQQGSCVLGA